MEEFYTPNYRRYLTPLTAERQRQRAARLRAAFPDAQATLEGTICGTHEGAFLCIPIVLTGIVRIENGRIAEEWGGLDQIDLLRQLGAVVSAAPR